MSTLKADEIANQSGSGDVNFPNGGATFGGNVTTTGTLNANAITANSITLGSYTDLTKPTSGNVIGTIIWNTTQTEVQVWDGTEWAPLNNPYTDVDATSVEVFWDVSYGSKDEFLNFIENEQCQFIESLGVDGLKKFEWYINEETNTATLIEEFDNAESFKEIATKAIGTPVNLKFREITTFENMTILGDVSDEMKENLSAMGPKFRTYKAGLN